MKLRAFALATSLLFSSAASALSIGGTNLPDEATVAGTALKLNGAGIRNKFFMDLYVGGLYAKAPVANGDAAMAADEPMSIRLHIISDHITSERMIKAAREGIEHATHGKPESVANETEAFLAAFKQPIKNGDVFEMNYAPATGVQVIKNGQPAATIQGLAFKKALFGIWLCDEPAQKSLKEAMLGHKD